MRAQSRQLILHGMLSSAGRLQALASRSRRCRRGWCNRPCFFHALINGRRRMVRARGVFCWGPRPSRGLATCLGLSLLWWSAILSDSLLRCEALRL
jgi:hypothetical protein